MNNYDELVRVAQNLGSLEETLERQYSRLREAVGKIKTGGETLQAAVVCRVNKIKYPDEVLAKIMQLQNAPYTPVEA